VAEPGEIGLAAEAPTTWSPDDLDPWDSVEVKSGQTLDGIFRQQGFSISLLHQLLKLDADTRNLKKIRPGDVFDFQRYADGSLRRMRYPVDEENYLVIDHANGELRTERMGRQITFESQQAEGQIESSLFLAGKQAGLNDGMLMKLAEIFGWDIDFVQDIRAGDRFYLQYERVYRDGEFLRDGEILAATFINQGERFQAIRYEQDGVANYFSPTGAPMRKAFLRAPLNFSYISSNFNPKRFHPILKKIRAHNGIDYRAPKGTPVYAAGAGSVIRSAYSATNGHHVFIKHDGGIETRYLHFTKRAVNQGARVRQGQVIGYVGDTGLATAAHLHYEFLVNGVHRNPRTIPLPQAVPLEGSQLVAFQAFASPFLNQLSRQESASLYASRE
jgi:murein DD-endopeptidase MepM/ murein hydrolase activator NlpD